MGVGEKKKVGVLKRADHEPIYSTWTDNAAP